MKKLYVFLLFNFFFLFAFSEISFAQKAKIVTNDFDIITIITAIGEQEIFTQSGKFNISNIEEIVFEKFDPIVEKTYSELSKVIKIEFGDGTNLGEISDAIESSNNSSQVDILEDNVFIKIDSIDLSQEELYSRAKSYLAYSFKSAQDVIQLEDKENGKLIAKGNFRSSLKLGLIKASHIIEFTFTIDLRDGKYRGIIEDLYHTGTTMDGSWVGGSFENEKPAIGTFFMTKSQWEKIKSQGRIDAVSHLDDFINYMRAKPSLDDF